MSFTAPLTLNLPRDVDGAGPDAGLADRIDAALPQTQCTRCGYPDCRAYAQAVASGLAAINRCPPGGEAGIQRLAALTGQPALPLDAACGAEAPRLLAVIKEADCIGCTLCIKACPVDCVLGAPKRMHTVIDAQCTGCELCVPACPVDCIAMVPINALITAPHTGWAAWTAEQAGAARQRYLERQARALRLARETDERLAANATTAATTTATTAATTAAAAAAKQADLPAHSQHTDPAVLARKRAVVEAALARARARQAERDAG